MDHQDAKEKLDLFLKELNFEVSSYKIYNLNASVDIKLSENNREVSVHFFNNWTNDPTMYLYAAYATDETVRHTAGTIPYSEYKNVANYKRCINALSNHEEISKFNKIYDLFIKYNKENTLRFCEE